MPRRPRARRGAPLPTARQQADLRVRAAVAFATLWPARDHAVCPPPVAAALVWLLRDPRGCQVCGGACTVFAAKGRCALVIAVERCRKDPATFTRLVRTRGHRVSPSDASDFVRALCSREPFQLPPVALAAELWPAAFEWPWLARVAVCEAHADGIAFFGRMGLFGTHTYDAANFAVDLPVVQAVRSSVEATRAVLPFVPDVNRVAYLEMFIGGPNLVGVDLALEAASAGRFDALIVLVDAGAAILEREGSCDVAMRVAAAAPVAVMEQLAARPVVRAALSAGSLKTLRAAVERKRADMVRGLLRLDLPPPARGLSSVCGACPECAAVLADELALRRPSARARRA